MKYKQYSKKKWTLLLVVLAALVALPTGGIFAQSALPSEVAAPLEKQAVGSAEVSFEIIEQESFRLRNNDAYSVRFELPRRWQVDQVEGENQLIVYYDLALSEIEEGSNELPADPTMFVTVDGIIADAVLLTQGVNQKLVVDLPADVFADPDITSHDVDFSINYGFSCDSSAEDAGLDEGESADVQDVFVTIHDYSFMKLSYELLPPSMVLADFPQPFGDASLLPIVLPIVVPDDADEATLQIAAGVAATFGRTASRVSGVELMTVNDVKNGDLDGRDAVIVGTVDDNSIVENFDLSFDGTSRTTGLLHATTSPNGENGYLLVTGRSIEGMERAVRALSAEENNVMLGLQTDMAFIDNITEASTVPFAETDTLSLRELGYTGRLYAGSGEQVSGVSFLVPADWNITDDAQLTLNYSASAALVQSASGLTVRLNRNPIGSVQAREAANGNHTMVIDIPASDIRPGEVNRLSFDVVNRVESCNVPHEDMLWSRIFDDGVLFLPHDNSGNIDRNNPIAPLLTSTDMADILFALPDEPNTEDMTQMLQTAWIIGRRSGGSAFQPQVAFGEVSDSVLADRHVVAIGEPSRNPMVAMVNEELPQPFDVEENMLMQNVGRVMFGLPSDYEVGVIESIAAPWDAQKSVVVISGTSAEGVAWAANSLVDSELSWQLNGNVAFIREDSINAIALETDGSERLALAEVNQAHAETVEAETTTVMEEVVVEEGVAEGETAANTSAVNGFTPGDYSVQPAATSNGLQLAAYGLFIVGAIAAVVGLLTSVRRRGTPAV